MICILSFDRPLLLLGQFPGKHEMTHLLIADLLIVFLFFFVAFNLCIQFFQNFRDFFPLDRL